MLAGLIITALSETIEKKRYKKIQHLFTGHFCREFTEGKG
jgi:hypothetical protein